MTYLWISVECNQHLDVQKLKLVVIAGSSIEHFQAFVFLLFD